MTAAAAECAADRAGRGVDGAHGDHRLREHGAAGMPNVQTETGQEAVDLLRHFQKAMAHRNHTSTLPETASLPEALTVDSTSLSEMANALVDITKTRVSISRQFKKNRFLMDTPYRDKGFAINVPTMLVNSRRHHAFMSSRNTCPPSIRHHALKMFAVD